MYHEPDNRPLSEREKDDSIGGLVFLTALIGVCLLVHFCGAPT